ncbi:MAG: endonuclease/exonuclease/phosphatase family protein [Planctomycetota bacterium]|nr:endonuclease/exonuclease/phosphatase family protein [Planctomycetota bacterium]
MKLISWNTAKRVSRAEHQAVALLERRPDIVALQEVNRRSLSILMNRLAAGGLNHVVSAVPLETKDSQARAIGVVIASRFPVSPVADGLTLSTWPEKCATALVESPLGPVEVNTVHVPPGASHGWEKIRVFEAVYQSLARASSTHRILCGDFNSPQAELETGEVVCWGKRLTKGGQWQLRRTRRGGSGLEWEQGEASVLVGLREFDLNDVFRRVNGYGAPAFSIEMKRRSTVTRRRFDHIFASESLGAVSCNYLHELREDGLSDHAPIEALFSGSQG